MPGDRPVKMGSFGSHLDELVRVIQHEPLLGRAKRELPDSDVGATNIRERLFGSAWRTARED